jgi:nucleotide-binding universal stress UspA family protein
MVKHMFTRILIATDGSDLAEKGIDQGLSLAKRLGADVTVVTVTESSVLTGPGTHAAWTNTPEIVAELEKEKAESSQKLLGEVAAKARNVGVVCNLLHVPNRTPADGIIETAEANGINLIVMASHGRRGLGRLLLGSQASEVLSRSKVPVLVVK